MSDTNISEQQNSLAREWYDCGYKDVDAEKQRQIDEYIVQLDEAAERKRKRASTTPTTQSREAELVFNECCKAMCWMCQQDLKNVAPDGYGYWRHKDGANCNADTIRRKSATILASTTPAPVGDESPSMVHARREGAVAVRDALIEIVRKRNLSGWTITYVALEKEFASLDLATILAQHREGPAGEQPG